MEGDFYGDSFSSLCFQYPCEYGEEYSGYHPEIDNEFLCEDAEIFDNTSVDARIVDEVQLEEPIYDEDLIQYDDDDDNVDDDNNEQIKKLVLNTENKFDTWNLAKKFLDDYTKQEGFTIRKRRRTLDPKDNTIIRRRTYECSYAGAHEPQKAVLEEDRRDRESHMTRCSWHIILAFSKSADKIQVNSIIGEYNHEMNPLIAEIAPKFRKLTDEMLEKIKFWTIHGRMGIATQYNLLVASFPQKVINKKDLNNAIQRFKKQVKPDKNDACNMLTMLYLKKDNNPRWIIKPDLSRMKED